MQTVPLGSQGLEVSELGLGCMGLTSFYGVKLPDDQAINVIEQAAAKGVTLFDTANIYVYPDFSRLLKLQSPIVCQEEIIAHAIAKVGRENIVIATKTGVDIKLIPKPGLQENGSPAFIRKQCEASLKRLQIDCIDLFYMHRIDPNTPIEMSMSEMKKLVEEGKVKYVGLSECSSNTLRRACKVHPVSAIQMEYSVWCRGIEHDLVDTCRELNVGIIAYSPLGRGFLGQGVGDVKMNKGDFRSTQARMTGDLGKKNAELMKGVEDIAKAKNISVAQLSLAWLRNKGKQLGVTVVPIPGTTKLHHLDSNVASMAIDLSDEDMQAIEEAIPWEKIEGGRYDDGIAIWETDKNRELTEAEAKELGL